MKITYDTEVMSDVYSSVDVLMINPESCRMIRDFEETYKQLTEFRKDLLERIAAQATTYDPNFKSISGDRIKLIYSAHGTKYLVDESLLGEIDRGLYTLETKVKPITEAIEEYTKDNQTLPYGILEPERKKSISIKIIE